MDNKLKVGMIQNTIFLLFCVFVSYVCMPLFVSTLLYIHNGVVFYPKYLLFCLTIWFSLSTYQGEVA